MKPTVHVQVQQQDLVDVDEVVVGAALPGRQIRVHLGPAQADHVVAVLAQERVVQPAVARGHDAGMAPGDGGRALHVHHAAADDQPLRRAHPGQAFVEGGHAHAAAVDALQQHDRQVHQQRPAGAGTGTVAQRRLEVRVVDAGVRQPRGRLLADATTGVDLFAQRLQHVCHAANVPAPPTARISPVGGHRRSGRPAVSAPARPRGAGGAAAVDALQQHDRQVHQQRPAGAGTGTVAQRRLEVRASSMPECDSRAAVSALMPRPAWISSRSASNTSVMPRTYRRRLPREYRPLVATAAPVGPPFPRPRPRGAGAAASVRGRRFLRPRVWAWLALPRPRVAGVSRVRGSGRGWRCRVRAWPAFLASARLGVAGVAASARGRRFLRPAGLGVAGVSRVRGSGRGWRCRVRAWPAFLASARLGVAGVAASARRWPRRSASTPQDGLSWAMAVRIGADRLKAVTGVVL
ncbi:hypothetical protein [Dactylosporangium matsuzakiense]|uniref:hypothetical protein n=1 Tax=Dactylosporangium matsuzakiense TaxID=53360 RepID=UPI0021C40175|nr:hypothetical protein [Dactylosporangium matsuzakiense]UWZ40894.1 hypothetical protein Dmats_24475 [Dactylosporangium matsuzakiense]